jgi:hypothetical protein
MKLKNIIAIMSSTIILGGGLMVVPSEAKTKISTGQWRQNFDKFIGYTCYDQPRQIKLDINKTIASYKKKGKRYVKGDYLDELERRFKIDDRYYATPMPKISSAVWTLHYNCPRVTEIYLYSKINKVSAKVAAGDFANDRAVMFALETNYGLK